MGGGKSRFERERVGEGEKEGKWQKVGEIERKVELQGKNGKKGWKENGIRWERGKSGEELDDRKEEADADSGEELKRVGGKRRRRME